MKNALLRLLYFLIRLTRPQTGNGSEIRTVLVLQYQMPLGCCVHGTPIYAAIKTSRPEMIVVVATRGLCLDVLQHDPNIDHLIETRDPTAWLQWKGRVTRQLRRELRRRNLKPDLILQDATNRRGLFALFALYLRLAPTVGFANAAALYDKHLKYDETLSLINNNLRLLEPFGYSSRQREPAVYFTQLDLVYAQSLLAGNSTTIAFVLQGSGGQNTFWHDDRFAEVIRYVEALGHSTVFLGTAQDAANIDRIRALASSQGRSLAGQTTIPELAAVLAVTDLLVTLDTGTMHVGRAVDVPMVVLGPSWQKPIEWLPLNNPKARILRGPDRADVPADYRLDEISTASVIASVDDLLAQYPPSPTAREARTAQRLSTTRV